MIFIDTETIGLCGPAVLLQWAENDGDIYLHEIWRQPLRSTLNLIERFCQTELCFFNAVFDWFQIAKVYTMFDLAIKTGMDENALPEDHIMDLAMLEPDARFGPCVKPKSAIDLMLHARKGPYQALMERRDIRVKRVPTVLAQSLADELEKRIELDGIYFARKKHHYGPRWRIDDDPKGDPAWKNIVLKFAASGALKVLANHVLGEKVTKYAEIALNVKPTESGWAPYARANAKVSRQDGHVLDWNKTWPELIRAHISHWAYNDLARQYAANDINYTRGLYNYFGKPAAGDDDSVLACYVGAARWRGYSLDLDAIRAAKAEAETKLKTIPVAPKAVFKYLTEVMDPTEVAVLGGSTKKVILEEIARWAQDDPDCVVAKRAQEVIDARKAVKQIEIYDKLLQAGRLHASFKITGTKSNRMSGDDDFNPQGVNKAKQVRACFTFADFDLGFILAGGDFDAFEVTLAEAVYKDPDLRNILLETEMCRKCIGKSGKLDPSCEECDGSGVANKKIHGLFGMAIYPGSTYDEIMADKERYTRAKSGFFSQVYFGDAGTLNRKLGIPLEVAEKALKSFMTRFKGIGKAQTRIRDAFQSMRQPDGIGTKVIWNEPQDYVESFLGFRRYFTLENKICKALFELAEKPPQRWNELKIKVRRRDRDQFAAGAVRSALFGAAFAIQSSNVRAAGNHEIQSPGAQITKRVQCAIWDLQPVGVSEWLVQPFNAHDELMCPCRPEVAKEVERRVYASIESYRHLVPLIKMKWKIGIKNWSEK